MLQGMVFVLGMRAEKAQGPCATAWIDPFETSGKPQTQEMSNDRDPRDARLPRLGGI